MKNVSFILTVILFGASIHAIAQKSYYPGAEWETKMPQELKINSTLLDSAVALARRSENSVEHDLRIANYKAYVREPGYKIYGPTKERGEPNGLIIKNGYIVAQWGDVERVDMTFSVTKSFLSTTAGIAWDNRLIKNISDKVASYIWDGTFDGPHNGKITWEHLLNQSSDWSGCQFEICDWADRPPREGSIEDWKNRKLIEPGTVFEYNDVRVNLLAYSLLQVLRKPLPIVLKEKIMDRIGASTTWRWHGYENSFVNIDGLMVQSVSGGGHFGGGLFINSLDQARFGLLFLREGKWKEEQLLSKQWVEFARQPSGVNKSYGYMWWTNAEGRFKSLPKSAYYAAGFGGNYIFIDNEHELVVVARWMDDQRLDEFLSLIMRAVKSH